MRPLTALLASALVAGACAALPVGTAGAVVPAAVVPAAVVPGGYVPVTPFRAVDTRSGLLHNHRGALRHGASITVSIGGHGGVPAHVAAVLLTITARSPSGAGGLLAYAPATRRPGVAALTFAAGRTAAATTLVRTSPTGTLTLTDTGRTGSTEVTVDVSGYFVAGRTGSGAGLLHTVAPQQLADRRVGARGAVTVGVRGSAGVPARGVAAVAVLLRAAAGARPASLAAYAAGARRPGVRDVYTPARQARTAFALVPTDGRGRITLYADQALRAGVEVLGWVGAGPATAAGGLTPRPATALASGLLLGANATRTLPVTGRGGVPRSRVSAVLVTVTATSGSRGGDLVGYRARTAAPRVGGLPYAVGGSRSWALVLPLSAAGAIALRNDSRGSVRVGVAVDAYLPTPPAAVAPPPSPTTPPVPSVSRYLDDLVGSGSSDPSADYDTMQRDGCADATAGSTLVLLDAGAQSVTPELSPADPGVALALTNPTVRLDYPDLVFAITGYLIGFGDCQPRGGHATVAVGTNNSGAFSGTNAYDATTRGRDWAVSVIGQLRSAAPASITVVGADDIENGNPDTDGFDGDVGNAQQWEAGYLAATPAPLLFNGAANGCPTPLGSVGGSCQDGWTQQQIYDLARGGGRVQVLPQIFNRDQAAQWANIDKAGGGGLSFAGVLTEHALDPTTLTPLQAWTALSDALGAVVGPRTVPAATDLVR